MDKPTAQQLMFSDQELQLIQGVFAENDQNLILIRKGLLQFPMTAEEKRLLKELMTPAVWAVVKKRVYPDLDPNAPLTQLGDIYQTLTNDLRTRGIQEMGPLFDAKQIEIEYLEQQFEFLKDPEADVLPQIILEDLKVLKGKTNYQQYVDTTARNFILGFVDPMLNLIKIMAGVKSETIEEKKKRLTRDSTE